MPKIKAGTWVEPTKDITGTDKGVPFVLAGTFGIVVAAFKNETYRVMWSVVEAHAVVADRAYTQWHATSDSIRQVSTETADMAEEQS